jgi:hypothetical protein
MTISNKDLARGTKSRLNTYKGRAAKSNHSKDWRSHYYGKGTMFRIYPNSQQNGKLYINSLDQFGELLGFVCPDSRHFDLSMKNEKFGWYGTHDCRDVIRASVIKLRCPAGTMYIPATDCTEYDCATLYIKDRELIEKGASEDDHEKAIRECARSAEHYAENVAEQSREDDAQQCAEHDIESARERIHQINKEALALIRELKQVKACQVFPPAICSALRDKLTALRTERGEQFAIIEKRQDDPWSAVENY